MIDPLTLGMLGVLFLAAVGLAIGIAVYLRSLRRKAEQRNEFVRAGQDDTNSPEAAASRAIGKASWMRPDGGGF